MEPDEDQASDENGSVLGNAVFVMVAIAFLFGAIPMTKMAFGPIVSSIQAQSWEETDATVLSSFVNVPHRRQYRLETQYTYEWEGTVYSGERVFFDEMVGVRKGYYNEVNRELLRHKPDDNPIRIWLDPENPDQSVIYRDVRWDKFFGNMIFFLIWAAITFGLVGGLVAQFRK